jgi:hypothetical protein
VESNREVDMNDSRNPFDRVIENPEYPFARIYRESFWQGIADAYDVIVGNHYRTSYGEDTHTGVLDILVFPLLSQQLMKVAFPTLKYKGEPPKEYEKTINVGKTKNGSSGYVTHEIPGTAPMPVRIVAGFFACVLEAPRAILGGLLTLCSLPIVATVHAVSSYKANKLRNEAKDLKVIESRKSYTSLGSTTKKLVDLLRNDITKVSGEVVSFYDNLTDISVDAKNATYAIAGDGKFGREFTIPEQTSDTTQSQSLNAFKELNIGGRRFR